MKKFFTLENFQIVVITFCVIAVVITYSIFAIGMGEVDFEKWPTQIRTSFLNVGFSFLGAIIVGIIASQFLPTNKTRKIPVMLSQEDINEIIAMTENDWVEAVLTGTMDKYLKSLPKIGDYLTIDWGDAGEIKCEVTDINIRADRPIEILVNLQKWYKTKDDSGRNFRWVKDNEYKFLSEKKSVFKYWITPYNIKKKK